MAVSGPQSRVVSSSPDVASRPPRGANAIPRTSPTCLLRNRLTEKVSGTRQARAVVSQLPLSKVWPSGLNARSDT